MILTFKVKHEHDFSIQLRQAKQVAKFAIVNRDKLSTKNVAHLGLKSAISNQILRKYGNNPKCKKVSRVKLIVPSQSVKWDKDTIRITPLDVEFQYQFRATFSKVNQIEIDECYFYVSVEVAEEPKREPIGWIGIDRNTTGHCAVAACLKTGKVMMLGKKAKHIHQKYSKIRKKFQRLGKLRKLKAVKRRESNITKDLNHKISRKVVNYAKQNNCGIKLEDLSGIRKTTKQARSFKYALNSWAYYQLQQFVEYKSQLAGVPVVYIEPAYTSQRCHKCGQLGNRNNKQFKCPHCGYTAHADVNAAWNIGYSEQLLVEPKAKQRPEFASLKFSVYNQQFVSVGDDAKGNTDIPQGAMAMQLQSTPEPHAARRAGVQALA